MCLRRVLLPVLLLSLRAALRADILLWRVLHDEGGQLVAHVQSEDMTARLARSPDHVFLHFQDSFRIFALLAEDELLDEAIEYVLHLASVVTAVDDVPLSLYIQLGLSTQLEPKVLGHVSWWPRQCPARV